MRGIASLAGVGTLAGFFLGIHVTGAARRARRAVPWCAAE